MKYKHKRRTIAESFERSRNPNHSGNLARLYLQACARRGELSQRQQRLLRVRDAAFMRHVCGYVAAMMKAMELAAKRMGMAFGVAASAMKDYRFSTARLSRHQFEELPHD